MMELVEIEQVVVRSLNTFVASGGFLVRNAFGIHWDDTRSVWTLISTADTPMCDFVGVTLRHTLQGSKEAHQGDPHEAFRLLIEPGYRARILNLKTQPILLFTSPVYQRAIGLINGWDGVPYLGSDTKAYGLGSDLAHKYKPAPINVLRLGAKHPTPSEKVDNFVDNS